MKIMRIFRTTKIFFVLIIVAIALYSCEKPCEHEYETTSMGAKCDVEVTNSKICSVCGDASYTTVPPTGHDYSETVVLPTCTEGGYTEYTCNCGFSYKSDIKSALGHDFAPVITPPTCETSGYTTYSCKNCDVSYKGNHFEPLGHNIAKNVIQPKCTEQGYTEFDCLKCDLAYVSDYKSPIGHDLVSVVTYPDCENGGYTTYKCKNCDYCYDSDHISPLGHSFTPKVLSIATCTLSGEVKYTCACGYSYSDITAPEGHSFNTKVVNPTVSDMGYTEFTCSCGFYYKGDYRFFGEILDNAYAGNNKVVARGIDISKWNHKTDENGNFLPLDWEAIAAAGVDYVILKAGSTIRSNGRKGGLEPTFEMDYAGAKAAGLDVGVYFFTYSTSVSQISKDAEILLQWLDGKQFEYPIYLDLEDHEEEGYFASRIAAPILTEMCLTFFSRLQSEGYYTGLYVNNEFLYNILQTDNVIELFEIWYARYPVGASYQWSSSDNSSFVWNEEKYGKTLGMWQYTRLGLLPPIEGEVDFNFAYKDYPALIKAQGFNGY